ncbi:MAG: M3 family metallopeptidase [Clostridiales Family XIII bacterium]|jgi:pepF/M3 family oligoendopeptidase|nr:M3 family metallopeptidase [Clostridiales Family XIII bacterium]
MNRKNSRGGDAPSGNDKQAGDGAVRAKDNSADHWDLSVLYDSFDDPRFTRDLNAAEELSRRLSDFPAKERVPTPKFLEDIQAFCSLAGDVSAFVRLTLMVEYDHAEANRCLMRIENLRTDRERILADLFRMLGAEDFDALHAEWRPYLPYIRDCRMMTAHMLPKELERTVQKMQQNGSFAWQELRNRIDATAREPLTSADALDALDEDPETPIGDALPLSKLRALANHPSQRIRKKAYEAETRCCEKHALPMAACFNAVKGEGLLTASLRGFDTVLDQMLFYNRMDRETLDAMMDAVRRRLPLFEAYLSKRARRAGWADGLPYHELCAPPDDDRTQYGPGEARALLTEVFADFHPEMGDLFRTAFADHWIDFPAETGKIGGALCCDLPDKGCSRILLNYSASYSGMRTIAHELGHAFHGLQLDGMPLAFRDAPTSLCETAAIFNETVLQKSMLRSSRRDARRAILHIGLTGATQGIVDIFSRFLFEDAAIRIRETRAPDAKELCALMKDAQTTAYGKGLNADLSHPFMWMCKPHYYIPDFHYYNFPYIFGFLFANGLYATYEREPSGFMKRYKQFLAESCAGNIYEHAMRIGMDLHDDAYWNATFEPIQNDFEAFMALDA